MYFAAMEIVPLPEFNPPYWLSNAHMQTVYASLFMPVKMPSYSRETIKLPDGDIIAADWVNKKGQGPLMVLVHGMEGDSHSRYARLLMSECERRNWTGVVLHMRSCGGMMNVKEQFYHAGFYDDIQYFMDVHLQDTVENRTSYLTGVSLGGSQIAHYLAKGNARGRVRAAAIVSTPLDLEGSADFMSAGLNRIYVLKFRNSLLKKYHEKSHLIRDPQIAKRLKKARTFWDLDNVATAPLHGFRDAKHYYSEMSSKRVLGDLKVPTLYIGSKDDPFMPEESMPENGIHFDNLQSCITEKGGHVGFVDAHLNSWMVKAVFTYLTHFGGKAPEKK